MAIAGEPVAAVGLGIPSVIEFATGRVRASVNVPLRDVPLRDVLEERLSGMPVYVDNDATCAGIAEAHDEHGQLDTPNLVMLTVGTGVGGGIMIDGLPYRGSHRRGGRAGAHDRRPRPLGGRARPKRRTASPRALPGSSRGAARSRRSPPGVPSTRWRARARRTTRTPPSAAWPGAGARSPAIDVLAAARAGDPHAEVVLTLLGERLGVGIANVINTFDPEVVAIGGGVSMAGELLLSTASDSARRFVLPGVGTRTEIRLARSGPQAGVRGAALLASLERGREHARDGRRARRGDATTI